MYDDFGICQEEPSLEVFDSEIARYKSVQAEIKELAASKTVGWLKIDAKPIKAALSTWVTKWIFLYTHHLSNRVVNSIEELYAFMVRSDGTLDKKVRGILEQPRRVDARAWGRAAWSSRGAPEHAGCRVLSHMVHCSKPLGA